MLNLETRARRCDILRLLIVPERSEKRNILRSQEIVEIAAPTMLRKQVSNPEKLFLRVKGGSGAHPPQPAAGADFFDVSFLFSREIPLRF